MDEFKDILSSRLAEIFEGETQQSIADRLFTGQSNVSKWLSGESVPPTNTLFLIAKTYKVSVDWLLGISDEKEVDSVSIEKLTYEQVARMLDRLMKYGCIEIPDLQTLRPIAEDEYDEERPPEFDSDYIKINDRALSFMFRRRMKLMDVDEEYWEMWIDNEVKRFNGVRLLNYMGKAAEALDQYSWSAFKAGDWASLLTDLGSKTEKELEALIKKNKEGKKNG